MSQEPNNLISEEALYASFDYGRELYVNLFNNDTPFVNLGYLPQQRLLAKKALLYLEGTGRLRVTGYSLGSAVIFGNADETDEEGQVVLKQLRRGGYHLRAKAGIPREVLYHGSELARSRYEVFESEGITVVAVVNVIPAAAFNEDIDALVRHLYEGTERGMRQVDMRRRSLKSRLGAMLTPIATYEAGWVDEGTKLELRVANNFRDVAAKGLFDPEDDQIDIWRRLPTIEFQGKDWVPFGLKPDVSRRATQTSPQEARGKLNILSVDDASQ